MSLRVNMTSEEFWKEWGRTSPPDRKIKDYIQQIEAPPAKFGSANKGKKHRQPQKKSINYLFEG